MLIYSISKLMTLPKAYLNIYDNAFIIVPFEIKYELSNSVKVTLSLLFLHL